MSNDLQASLSHLMPEFRAFARSVAVNPSDFDDIVQDAVERALRSDGVPTDVPSLRRWMFRVIRNLNIDTVRKIRVRREYSAAQARLYDDMPAMSDTARDTLVRIAFEALPPATREVLFLVDIMGLKYSEAAEVMDVPDGTVMSRLSRARKVLCERIAGPVEAKMKQSQTT